MLYLVKIILVWTVGMLGTWHRANSGDVYLQIFNLCLRPLHIVLGPGPGSSQYCVSPHQECDDVICGVHQVAVPGAGLLLLPTRTMGRARSHGGAGHYSTARDRRVLPLVGGLLRKSRYDNHRKRVKNMF